MMFSAPALFGRLMESITTLLCEYLAARSSPASTPCRSSTAGPAPSPPPTTARTSSPTSPASSTTPAGLGVPLILFVRGNANLLTMAAELPADVLGVDWSIDLDRAIALTGPDRVVQGNLDPMVLLGPADLVEQKARAAVAAGRAAKAHIFNLGHGISRHTDPAIAKHLVDVVHSC
jgi:uroporphyrinogen decarboxylase